MRETFEKSYAPLWEELEETLDELDRIRKKKGPHSLRRPDSGGSGISRFPELYRQACHHLALARHRHYGADLEQRLNALVLRGHQHLYRERHQRLASLLAYTLDGFPRLVRREAGLFWLAFALLFVPAVVMTVLVNARPELALSLLPAEMIDGFTQSYGPGGSLERGRPVDSDLLMFGFYIYNNVGIAFKCFAGGIAFGVGSISALVYNGLFFGAVAGHIHHAGYEANFYPFVIGHGAFELIAIVLSGMAGLKIGLSLVAPGRLSRLESLRTVSLESFHIVIGSAVMLVVAAFLEAFWSSASEVSSETKLVVGVLLWALVAFYLLLFGRSRAA